MIRQNFNDCSYGYMPRNLNDILSLCMMNFEGLKVYDFFRISGRKSESLIRWALQHS